MHELLGIVLGAAIGGGVAAIRPQRLRPPLLLPALLPRPACCTSAINGELESGFWGVFVAADTLLVALGFVLGLALSRARPRAPLRGLDEPGLVGERRRPGRGRAGSSFMQDVRDVRLDRRLAEEELAAISAFERPRATSVSTSSSRAVSSSSSAAGRRRRGRTPRRTPRSAGA